MHRLPQGSAAAVSAAAVSAAPSMHMSWLPSLLKQADAHTSSQPSSVQRAPHVSFCATTATQACNSINDSQMHHSSSATTCSAEQSSMQAKQRADAGAPMTVDDTCVLSAEHEAGNTAAAATKPMSRKIRMSDSRLVPTAHVTIMTRSAKTQSGAMAFSASFSPNADSKASQMPHHMHYQATSQAVKPRAVRPISYASLLSAAAWQQPHNFHLPARPFAAIPRRSSLPAPVMNPPAASGSLMPPSLPNLASRRQQ